MPTNRALGAYIQNQRGACKPFGELAKAFLTLAIFACEDKAEQKARILIAYEDGNLTQKETADLIRTLGLAAA